MQGLINLSAIIFEQRKINGIQMNRQKQYYQRE